MRILSSCRLKAVVLAALSLLAAACAGGGEAGPVGWPPPMTPDVEVVGQRATFALRVGQDSTLSGLTLFNHGARPAVLDGVELVGGAGGIEVIGALAAVRPRLPGCNVISSEDFPPDYDWPMEPLEGFVIPPASAFEGRVVCVILGLRPTRRGVVSSQGVAIHYHVGDRAYTYVDPYSLASCTPDVPDTECKAPEPIRSLP